jgi:CheY-like chemotaxis protein
MEKVEGTILYIDDDQNHQELIRKILDRRPNIILFCASRALLGIEMLYTHNPDLVISDINMPDMNGFEVLKYLKTHEETQDIPVIALSGYNTPKDIKRGLKAGFDFYITKPIDVLKFLEIIDSVLASPT